MDSRPVTPLAETAQPGSTPDLAATLAAPAKNFNFFGPRVSQFFSDCKSILNRVDKKRLQNAAYITASAATIAGIAAFKTGNPMAIPLILSAIALYGIASNIGESISPVAPTKPKRVAPHMTVAQLEAEAALPATPK